MIRPRLDRSITTLFAIVLGSMLSSAGCFLDPTCTESCDGDQIHACQ